MPPPASPILQYLKSFPLPPLTRLLRWHATVSCALGSIGVLLPHHFWWGNIGENHLALEYLRLYSASLLTSSYLLFTLSSLKSPQTRYHITRSFVLLYALHFIVLLRAQLTGGELHGGMGWLGVIMSAALAGMYGDH
ncbi:hypothetical protein TrCOL_g12714 [Triparma columacea]|uniref:Uncharacterized protein n=1 Tax=Triparma columacea TaxID=722753 RepID=A0A9W7LBX6_9STRA|nr:hypothetical protein TrCOL_g12714 [Triparma columacea]